MTHVNRAWHRRRFQCCNPSIGLSPIMTIGPQIIVAIGFLLQSLNRAFTYYDIPDVGEWEHSCMSCNPSIGLSPIMTTNPCELPALLLRCNPSIGLSPIMTSCLATAVPLAEALQSLNRAFTYYDVERVGAGQKTE